jgi:hypothetical protein
LGVALRAFGVQRLVFSVWRSAFGVEESKYQKIAGLSGIRRKEDDGNV